MVIYEPKTKNHMRMILRENYIDENAFRSLHGEGHKHDFIFINKTMINIIKILMKKYNNIYKDGYLLCEV